MPYTLSQTLPCCTWKNLSYALCRPLDNVDTSLIGSLSVEMEEFSFVPESKKMLCPLYPTPFTKSVTTSLAKRCVYLTILKALRRAPRIGFRGEKGQPTTDAR